MKFLRLIPIALAVVLIICAALIRFQGQGKAPPSSTSAASPTPKPVVQGTPRPASPASVPSKPVVDSPIPAMIASPDLSNTAIADKLLDLLPTLSPDEQAEAAQHIVNLTNFDDSARWTTREVAGDFPEPAAEIFYNELSNLPDDQAFPALAAIADNPNHPKRADSVEMLSVIFTPPEPTSTWKDAVKKQMPTADKKFP